MFDFASSVHFLTAFLAIENLRLDLYVQTEDGLFIHLIDLPIS